MDMGWRSSIGASDAMDDGVAAVCVGGGLQRAIGRAIPVVGRMMCHVWSKYSPHGFARLRFEPAESAGRAVARRSSVRAVGLSQLAVRRRCGACAQLRRGQAVAATNLLGIITLRLAEQVAPGAGLALHPAPFQLTIAHLCQVWHPHNTAKRAQAGLRQQVKDLFRRWATDHAADVVVTVMQAL